MLVKLALAASLQCGWLQVRSVQRGVTALLEALVHHGLAELPMARQPGSPASMPPSLMLLKDLLMQVGALTHVSLLSLSLS